MTQNPVQARAGTAEEMHWGRRTRCYVNRPPTVDAAFRTVTAATPHLEALIEGATRLTYPAPNARIDALAAGLAAKGVRVFCAARMADYKVPNWVVVSDSPLPRNANGKVQKDQLRQMAARHVASHARPGAKPR